MRNEGSLPGLAAVMLASTLFATAARAVEPMLDPSADAGKTIRLKLGESVRANDGNLRIGFEEVRSDSRCPKGERCFWAGDATILIWLQVGAESKVMRELHTSTTRSKAGDKADATAGSTAPDLALQVVRLDPMPISGQPIAKRDYVVTLKIGPGESSDPVR